MPKYHKAYDACIVKIGNIVKDNNGRYKIDFLDEVKSMEIAKSGIVGVNISSTRPFEDALISNDVFIFGYPTSLGIKETPLVDSYLPLLRKGIIAGKNKAKKSIIIDCPTYFGNSGGPVMMVEKVSLTKTKFPIIGIVGGFVPFKEKWINPMYKTSYLDISNSGYSVVTPIDVVLELLPKQNKGTEQRVDSLK